MTWTGHMRYAQMMAENRLMNTPSPCTSPVSVQRSCPRPVTTQPVGVKSVVRRKVMSL